MIISAKEPQFLTHLLAKSHHQRGLIGIKRTTNLVGSHQARKRLPQTMQIPISHRRLVIKRIASLIVRVVTDKTGLVIVDEGIGAKIDGQSQNRHVVGIHHPVRKPLRLPQCDQTSRSLSDIAQPKYVTIFFIHQMWPMMANRIIRQLSNFIRLLAVIEVLEMAKTQVAFSDAHQHRTALRLLAENRLLAGDYTQCSGRRNAEMVQCFGGQKFADHRSQYRAAITHS